MSDSPPLAQARQRHYAQAESWSADIHGSLRRSRRVAWYVAGAAAVVAALEALALAAMAPLKTVVPYTILVDKQTGYVETVRALAPGNLTQDQALTQSFIVQYVLARETFDASDLRENYRKIMLWSAGEAQSQYRHDLQKTNPTSPLNLYPASTVVSTTIKSVSLLSPTTALVRFDTIRRDAGGGVGEQRSWAAVLAFRYSAAAMRMGDRFINPLGFQVTRYRRDAEGIAAAPVRVDAVTAPVP